MPAEGGGDGEEALAAARRASQPVLLLRPREIGAAAAAEGGIPLDPDAAVVATILLGDTAAIILRPGTEGAGEDSLPGDVAFMRATWRS